MKKSWLLIGGGLFAALIVAAIVVVLAVEPKESSYDPASPEGVVQGYLRAIRDEDFEQAKRHIDPAALENCQDPNTWNSFAREQLENTTVTLRRASITGTTADVAVNIQQQESGVFASRAGYGYQVSFRLAKRNGQWLLGGSSPRELPWPLYGCPKPVRPPL